MPTIHLCDPQLSGNGGHYLNHDAQLARDLLRRGYHVKIYGRADCRLRCEGLEPLPVFSWDIFNETGSDAEIWAIENFHALNLPAPPGVRHASIGPITSKTMLQLGLAVDLESKAHDIPGLVSAIVKFYKRPAV